MNRLDSIRMKALLTLFSFWVCFQIMAQPRSLFFKNYSEKEGLSETTVQRLLIDSRGHLWATSFDGLNRFDGYEFKVFRTDPNDSTTIDHNTLFSVYEDSEGYIWAGSKYGLNKFDPSTSTFKRFIHKGNDATTVSNITVTDIIEDSEGNIWASTHKSGIVKLDRKTGVFTTYLHSEDDSLSIGQNSALSLEFSRDGKLLIGLSAGGLSIMDTKNETFETIKFKFDTEPSEAFRHNVIRDIYEDNSGLLWLATYKGLIKYDRNSRIYNLFLYDASNKYSIPANSVHDIEPANDTAFWLVTYGGGLSYFDLTNERFHNFNKQNKGLNLKTNAFYNVKKDGEHLWVGTSMNGIYNTSLQDGKIKFMDSHFFFPDLQDKLKISMFSNGPDDVELVSFSRGNLAAFHAKTGEPLNLPFLKYLNKELAGNYITFTAWRSNNILWIGTDRRGLYKYNINTKELKHYAHGKEEGNLSHTHVSTLWFDHKNRLWVGTAAGINLYRKETDNFENWNAEIDKRDGLQEEYIGSIFNDAKGNVWIGSSSGLHLFDEKEDKFYKSFYSASSKTHLKENRINAIVEDDHGVLWIGTHNGIFKMHDTDSGYVVEKFQPKQPLESGIINGLFYKAPKLWAATAKGVLSIDIANNNTRNYKWDRLESNDFSGVTMLQQTQQMIFLNLNTSIFLNPDNVERNNVSPNLYLTDIKIFNESVTESEDLLETYPDKGISSMEKIVLPYHASYLSFEFSAVDLYNAEKIRYAYRLIGFQDDWIFANKRRFAAYSNLDPGEYTFEVKVANGAKDWEENTKHLMIVIEPPFWRTWWFTLLGVLFFLGIFYALHRFRLERALEVERLRVRIASDLHDDIGATLTKISLYADLLQSGNGRQSKESNQLLNKIAGMGRDTLRNLADIVWAIDARNDSLGNLINKIQEFAMDMLSKKDIEVEFTKKGIDMDASIGAEKRQHVYLICKEAINNIFKHANATKVNISFMAKNHKIDITISDNGNGLPKEKKSELGNGLRNIEQRAKKLAADLHMKEENGLSIMLQGIGL